jgi:hypothetical protein
VRMQWKAWVWVCCAIRLHARMLAIAVPEDALLQLQACTLGLLGLLCSDLLWPGLIS